MISDVLFETVEDLNRYLTSPIYAKTYQGRLRMRIIKVRNEMERGYRLPRARMSS
jgi:hypothetical protein